MVDIQRAPHFSPKLYNIVLVVKAIYPLLLLTDLSSHHTCVRVGSFYLPYSCGSTVILANILLDEDGGDIASLHCGDVCQFLQSISTDLAEISEKEDKGEFNSACQVSVR